MVAILGENGDRLLAFSRAIDITHPDLQGILDGTLTSPNETSYNRLASDALRLGTQKDLCPQVIRALADVVMNHSASYLIQRTVNDPQVNMQFIRFLPNRARRDRLRSNKTPQNVLGSKFVGWDWDDYDLDRYFPGVHPFEEDLKVARKRLEQFQKLNLPGMAKEIEDSITRIEMHNRANQHLGFNTMDLGLASFCLAKLHGYVKVPVGDLWGVRAPQEALPDYKFWSENNSAYCPRLYAYSAWQQSMPHRVADIIDYLEEHPAFGGKPAFDHYQVLVPGVERRDVETTCTCSVDYRAVQINLDKELVQHKNLIPILLGERDGVHYFICYWM